MEGFYSWIDILFLSNQLAGFFHQQYLQKYQVYLVIFWGCKQRHQKGKEIEWPNGLRR